jgi:rare lipoprotein A
MKGKNFGLAAILFLGIAWAASAFQAEGFASWYGGKFVGRSTANGEIFDTNLLTAAHKTLPFGSKVLVTNLDNEKSVIVRINDRGPFVEDRIIDLSRAAADAIGLTALGVARVKLDVVHLEKAEPFATLQLASYASQDNALRQKKRLLDAGLSPSLETTEKGNIRLLLENIPETGLEETKKRLAELGYKSVIVRNKTNR